MSPRCQLVRSRVSRVAARVALAGLCNVGGLCIEATLAHVPACPPAPCRVPRCAATLCGKPVRLARTSSWVSSATKPSPPTRARRRSCPSRSAWSPCAPASSWTRSLGGCTGGRAMMAAVARTCTHAPALRLCLRLCRSNVPYDADEEFTKFLIKEHHIDFIVHGDDPVVNVGRCTALAARAPPPLRPPPSATFELTRTYERTMRATDRWQPAVRLRTLSG